MLGKLYSFFKDLFETKEQLGNLESYIMAGNPQTAEDVEMLERGFYNREQRNAIWGLERPDLTNRFRN